MFLVQPFIKLNSTEFLLLNKRVAVKKPFFMFNHLYFYKSYSIHVYAVPYFTFSLKNYFYVEFPMPVDFISLRLYNKVTKLVLWLRWGLIVLFYFIFQFYRFFQYILM